MRNLKRALSLALASVMLLGMMVVGTSAASTNFPDDADIVNKEAAAITAGLGIFSGYTDGSFGATNIVTRAEMATIVVKMLYGSDYNADPFKGAGKFTDVADYQGGWAEGYVNLCANLGIIAGYGDGTFRPGNTLTTAEAITFIINALDIDAGEGQWPITVMAKGEELGLFGDLEYKTKAGMTRDDLAVIVYEGLTYSATAGKVWTVNGKEFESFTEAMLYCALTTADDEPEQVDGTTGSLADTVFGLKSYTGILLSTPETTTNTYSEFKVGDETKQISVAGSKDLVGHMVTVYYDDDNTDTENGKKVGYTIVDESKIVKASRKRFQTAAYAQSLLGLENKVTDDVTTDTTVSDYVVTSTPDTAVIAYTNANNVEIKAGTYIVYDGEVIGKKTTSNDLIVLTVTEENGNYTVKNGGTVLYDAKSEVDLILTDIEWSALVGEGESADVVYSYSTIGAYYTLSELKTVTGTVTKVTDTSSTDYVYIGGKQYTVSTKDGLSDAVSELELTAISAMVSSPDFKEEYVFYLDGSGYVFGFGAENYVSDANLVLPVYAYKLTDPEYKNEYGETIPETTTYWVQCVTMSGAEVLLQVAAQGDMVVEGDWGKFHTYTTTYNESLETTVATFEKVLGSNNAANNEVQGKFSASDSVGSYKVVLNNNNYFLNDDYTVIYINGYGSELTTKVVAADKDRIVAGAFLYGAKADEKDTTTTNYELKYVVVNGNENYNVTGEEVVYVNSMSKANAVSYTKADGSLGTAYQQTIYIDGTAKTIVVDAAEAEANGKGFYTYKVNELGLYDLTKVTEGVAVNEAISSMYKGIMTVDGIEGDVSNAKIINLISSTNQAKALIPTDPTKLDSQDTVSVALNEDGEIEFIYVISSTRKIKG